MKKSFAYYSTICLISLSYVQSSSSKIFPDSWFLKDIHDGIQFSKKEAPNVNEYWFKESEEIIPTLQAYIITRLRQNTINALQELTNNWKIVPRQRTARQGEAVVVLRDVITRSESTLETVGSGFRMADTIIQSIVGILRVAVGRPFPIASQAKQRRQDSSTGTGDGEKKLSEYLFPPNPKEVKISGAITKKDHTEEHKGLNSDNLPTVIDSLRDKSYSDQLIGALNILASQENPSRINQEIIKFTVDYIVDVYIATNGKTQALFLPPLFEGITTETKTSYKSI